MKLKMLFIPKLCSICSVSFAASNIPLSPDKLVPSAEGYFRVLFLPPLSIFLQTMFNSICGEKSGNKLEHQKMVCNSGHSTLDSRSALSGFDTSWTSKAVMILWLPSTEASLLLLTPSLLSNTKFPMLLKEFSHQSPPRHHQCSNMSLWSI